MKKLKLQWKGIYALLLMLWSVPLPAQFPLVEQISSNFITSFAEDPKDRDQSRVEPFQRFELYCILCARRVHSAQ